MAHTTLIPRDEPDEYDVQVEWGDRIDLPVDTDGGAVEQDIVSVSYLSRLEAQPRDDLAKAESALDRLLGGR
jgi:hypothetical protein